ncbi:hypothetical protein L3X38_030967 [Prunus dulcis]|uniref:Uncharacterized protein n=1 Tax=Prunus dulcis TaxID=3755 RepID=A0AAD4YUH7_PRUDU|nr:hypothetical protein L3X38_030967 [Prunus dulcis]
MEGNSQTPTINTSLTNPNESPSPIPTLATTERLVQGGTSTLLLIPKKRVPVKKASELLCISKGATSAAFMEFSDNRRCKCTSLHLHRSATVTKQPYEHHNLGFATPNEDFDHTKVKPIKRSFQWTKGLSPILNESYQKY